jgi:hypothetical protein
VAVTAGWCGPDGVTTEWTVRFSGAAVMTVEATGELAAWSQRRRRGGTMHFLDGRCGPRHGDGVEVVGVAAAQTRWSRRRHGKFWQPDGIEVKILRLRYI